jgi:hypothetical protein
MKRSSQLHKFSSVVLVLVSSTFVNWIWGFITEGT